MFTMAIAQRGRHPSAKRMPEKASHKIAMLAALILVSISVNAAIILADGKAW